MAAGSVEAEDAEEKNVPALEMLRKLPGVNDSNIPSVLAHCDCLADLLSKTEEELCVILGNRRNAVKLLRFAEEYV